MTSSALLRIGVVTVAGGVLLGALVAGLLWVAASVLGDVRESYVRGIDERVARCAQGAPPGSDPWGGCEARYGSPW